MPGPVEKKTEVVSGKLEYFDAIRGGLISKKSEIPHLDVIIKEINGILLEYNKPEIRL